MSPRQPCTPEAPSGRPCPSPGHMGAAGSAGGTDAAGSPVLRPRGPAATAAPCPASGSTLPQGLSFHSRSSGHPPAGAGVHPRPRKGPPGCRQPSSVASAPRHAGPHRAPASAPAHTPHGLGSEAPGRTRPALCILPARPRRRLPGTWADHGDDERQRSRAGWQLREAPSACQGGLGRAPLPEHLPPAASRWTGDTNQTDPVPVPRIAVAPPVGPPGTQTEDCSIVLRCVGGGEGPEPAPREHGITGSLGSQSPEDPTPLGTPG